MLLSSRSLRRALFGLLCTVPGLSSAQSNQFQDLLKVQQTTGGRVASFLTGTFQQPPGGTDILYVDAAAVGGASSSVTVGELLNQGGAGFVDLGENRITFMGVSNVVAAEDSFLGNNIAYAFALTTAVAGGPNLCIYAGTGAQAPSQSNPQGGGSSFSGGNTYPANGGESGCTTISTSGSAAPQFGYIASFRLQTGLAPQLLVEDTANGYVYLLSLSSAVAASGRLSGIAVLAAIPLAVADGPGPITMGDFNGDGNTDFIVNGQTGYSATVYLGNGAGGFTAQAPLHFDANVRSMLMYDMDGRVDTHNHPIQDLVVEGNSGAIEIFQGNGDGTFQTTSEGGTQAGAGSLTGDGGRLVAINPNTLDILTATPIGLSLLQRQSGTLSYALKAIYNIGSGRSSFALNAFYSSNTLDLAVDSAEGVAIVPLNSDGTLQTSKAYSALAPALGAVVAPFRTLAHNPQLDNDVVVATGALQGQLLTGNGNGTFNTFPGVLDTDPNLGPPYNLPPGLWSNLLAGDFDGDGTLDVFHSLTGLPQTPPGGISALVSCIQYGKGDGTFSPPGNCVQGAVSSSNPNGLYTETATGDFNGDGASDFSLSNAYFDEWWLGIKGNRSSLTPGSPAAIADSSNTDFSQVATGFFKVNRVSRQDMVFQQGASFIPYVNQQDGTGMNFTAMPALAGAAAPLYPSTVLLTDVDHDGNGDLAVVYYNGGVNASTGSEVYVWWGNGDGTFVQTPLVLTLSRNYFIGAVADMNADGLPDLVLSDGSLVSILYNQGNRSFGTVLTTGELSSEQHFLAGQGINSIALADVNGDGVPDLVAANGGLTMSNAVALGGRTASSISLAANPSDIATGGITVLLNSITTKPVTGTLVASPEPSEYEATFTMTATLTPSPGVASPTGVVQFYIDDSEVGGLIPVTAGATNSTTSYVVPVNNGYAGGVHAMTARYYGDAANSPVTLTGATGTHQVQTGTTTTALYLCVGPTTACPSTGYVMPPYVAMLTMIYGQTYNGTAQVTASDGGTLSGNTLFYDNYNGAQTLLCTLTTSAGGSCPPTVGTGTMVGTHVLTAVYSGDPAHTGSTSAAVTIVVSPDTVTATLVGSPNPSPAGQPVTFTATLLGNNAPTGHSTDPVGDYLPPAGPVVFSYAGSVLGTASLASSASGTSSTATFATSSLPVGMDLITATYAPTLDFGGATATFTETITPSLAGSFTLTVAPTPVSVGVGYSTLLTVTVTPQNGFTQAVNLACANLPVEASCFFDTQSLTNGGGVTSLIVATTAPHTCGSTQPYFLGFNGSPAAPFALPALAGLFALFVPGRRRRWLRVLIAVAAVAGLAQVTGCGTCTDLGTKPATYTFQVTGTASGTGAVQSQPVTITVTI